MSRKPKIVVIGGGTGSFAVLSGLKSLDCTLTALVSMADDGGSTGQLMDEYGVLPPGDIRQCLVALSTAPKELRDLFNFRFSGDSTLGGHSFGNLFLSAVEMMTSNFSEAVDLASDILNIEGRVLPVTTQKCQLVMKADGKTVVGQREIELNMLPEGVRPKLTIEPDVSLTAEAKRAISQADLLVIAPGSLYCSITAALLVNGMVESIKKAKAKVVYVCNLVNKPAHTKNFKVSDYVYEIEKVIGKGAIDYVLYNVDIPNAEILSKYAEDEEYPVIVDEYNLKKASYKAIAGNFLSHKKGVQDKNDRIKRSLLRHNGLELADIIQRHILTSNSTE